MNQQITTKYIVREVREQYQKTDSPIVIICDKSGIVVNERRRIAIKNYQKQPYEMAKLLTAGDIFELTEDVVLNRTSDDGTNVRILKNIALCFRVERI